MSIPPAWGGTEGPVPSRSAAAEWSGEGQLACLGVGNNTGTFLCLPNCAAPRQGTWMVTCQWLPV